MILQDFNNGWGANFELRQWEQQVLFQYLGPWYRDDCANIIVNSTWYNREYHERVLDFIHKHRIDRVALVSFMDPSIVKPDWFGSVSAQIHAIGYYQGTYELDAWALIVDQYFQTPCNLDTTPIIDTAFMCLNRKPHWHRRQLVARLDELSLLDKGIVSLGDESGQPLHQVANDPEPSAIAPNAGADQYGIVNDIMSLGSISAWNRFLVNVVTETVFDVDRDWFVSEKIYKPVLGLRPFLVYAPNGANTWLSHIGLESYCDDFDDITDLDLRQPNNIPVFLQQLAMQDASYWNKKYKDLVPKMQTNHERFCQHVGRTRAKVQNTIYNSSS